MKAFLSFALAAIVAGAAFANTGNEKNNRVKKGPVSIEVTDEGKVKLIVRDENKGRVNIEIFKDDGKKLFEKSVGYKKSFSMPFDLSQQEEGTFKFVVKGNGLLYEQEVFNSKLHTKDVYATIDEVDDKIYNVTVRHEGIPVLITIRDEKGRKIYSRTYLQDSNFQQRFDLRQVESENVEITISGQKSYIRSIL